MHLPRAVYASAANTLGLLTIADLRRCGVSSDRVTGLVASGALERVHRGVYRVGCYPSTLAHRALAATIACGENAVASHATAAALWGLGPEPERMDVLVPYARRSQRPGITVHRSKVILTRDVTSLGRVPVTRAHRTLADLSGAVDPRVLERSLDDAIRRRLVVPRQLTDVAGPVGRLAIERIGGAPESELERKALAVVKRYHLPRPALQYKTLGYRLDMAYPRPQVAIELDGWSAHFGKESRQSDYVRQNRLELAGWKVLRFTWDDITLRPREVARQVREALNRS
jgi:very-short-patch-repair endonuclease